MYKVFIFFSIAKDSESSTNLQNKSFDYQLILSKIFDLNSL
jgi:hypothetical protein